LSPHRVLLVEPQPASWPQHRELLDGHPVTHVHWRRGRLYPDQAVRDLLDDVDVLYTAETVYDPELPFVAAEHGCVVVRHANPEQLGVDELIDGDPTVWWSATPWRLAEMPAGTRVVPMPVEPPPKGFAPNANDANRPVRFVHTVGHAAQEDRAGTRIVAQAVKTLRARCEVHVWCQDRQLHVPFKIAGKGVDLTVRTGGVDDRWDLYRGGDVLVLPRRYGGLSLPSQEAMAAGLALVMTDCSPNEVWPGPRVKSRRRWWVHMRCGQVEMHDADPGQLTLLMQQLAEDRDEVDKWKAESRAWAEANTWDALRPLWLEELERASLSPGRPAAPTGNEPGSGCVPV
jgi:glycosyltransferase involved in cell wall biosynthesis